MTKVYYSCGRTLNMGNYESARFDFGLELDCKEEEVEEKMKEAEKFVAAKVKEEEHKWLM